MLTAEQQAKEVKRIKNSNNWPHWPLLPVKKIGRNRLETGVVLFSNLSTVHLGNIFMLPDDLSTLPKKEYASVEAMVADGWEGD